MKTDFITPHTGMLAADVGVHNRRRDAPASALWCRALRSRPCYSNNSYCAQGFEMMADPL